MAPRRKARGCFLYLSVQGYRSAGQGTAVPEKEVDLFEILQSDIDANTA